MVSTQADSVHFSCLLQFQKCTSFPLLALKNSLLTQKNLIKMLPVLFVTHSWNMAPRSAYFSSFPPGIGWIPAMSKERIKTGNSLQPFSTSSSYALTMCLSHFFFGGCAGSFIATRAFLRCGHGLLLAVASLVRGHRP